MECTWHRSDSCRTRKKKIAVGFGWVGGLLELGR
jgi:hypothetical protein